MVIFHSLLLALVTCCLAKNSTIVNPILSGFHPDPSCIFVAESETFFCASSSFSLFPGIPIHASRDLKSWKLISNALNRPEQLPTLSLTNKSTSGIWAPALRYHQGTFYILTTLVFDDQDISNSSRWDNLIFKTTNPYDSASWSDPVHFSFPGYDTSPFWDSNGQTYVTGAHPWQIQPGILQATIDLETGKVGELVNVWNGTGGLAPEGPHIFRKDGFYYLMIAEGGTGLNHMETIARSKNGINGPYDPNPANPILTNANTSQYFQTVGHADLFQDASGNYWGVALSTRSGSDYLVYPMGRETVLTPASWPNDDWPVLDPVRGEQVSWALPLEKLVTKGGGNLITDPDDIQFSPGSALPPHFGHWRLPIPSMYTISSPGHPNTLRLRPSNLNLTGYDGNYAGPAGQTFVGRRQVDSLFVFRVNMAFKPQDDEEEAGVSVFLTQNHHIDMGVVMLPDANTTKSTPHFRFRAVSYLPVPDPVIVPVSEAWWNHTLTLEIKAVNLTHYAFSAALADQSAMQTIAFGLAADVSFAFTGTLVGIYATTNGNGDQGTPTYFSEWRYEGLGQVRS
ncbi:xylosidase : arab-like proteininofuranosidase [Mycena floridula]|nr:xylosidase : arab-like proteininofuranosidase [Mycena floridula]